jgi:hypothetical protein
MPINAEECIIEWTVDGAITEPALEELEDYIAGVDHWYSDLNVSTSYNYDTNILTIFWDTKYGFHDDPCYMNIDGIEVIARITVI